MSTETLTKLVTAWRLAKKLSDGMENIFDITVDYMYDIHGNILDALREYVFEEGDIEDSDVLRMLKWEADSKYVAIALSKMHDNKMLNESTFQQVQQPAPKFFTDEQIARMQEVFGGVCEPWNLSS